MTGPFPQYQQRIDCSCKDICKLYHSFFLCRNCLTFKETLFPSWDLQLLALHYDWWIMVQLYRRASINHWSLFHLALFYRIKELCALRVILNTHGPMTVSPLTIQTNRNLTFQMTLPQQQPLQLLNKDRTNFSEFIIK
jgi:hypothetical protein